jgi:OOP family OmpA-OmpF porin
MKPNGKVGWGILVGFLLIAGLAWAQEDIPDSQDHPLLTRMPDFYISDYVDKDFDTADFKNEKGEETKVEGHIYDIFYKIKEGKEPPGKLQVLRNYENAIKAIGGSTVYESGKEAWLKVEKAGATTWIYVDARTLGEYELMIVEKEAMKQNVVADAKSLAQALTATGHASVYGIFFDFNKSTVRPQSDAALKEIAKLLKQDPGLSLYVVGHTDDVGQFDYNLRLSTARAEAVVKTLVEKYGVSQSRLDPHGVGPLAPLGSNETEESRTLNRRVELVKKHTGGTDA